MKSKAFELNKNDLVNIAKNALLVGIAAALTYFGENLSKLDLGTLGVMLVPVVSVIVDTFTKWINGPKKEEETK